MQAKKLIPLLIVAILLCLAALTAYYKQNAPADAPSGDDAPLALGNKLFADLDETLGNVARVEIEKEGEKIVLARDANNDWTVESSGNYPADRTKINKMLAFDLADISILDSLTKSEKKYDNFGLQNDTGAYGVVLMSDSAGEPIARLLCGDAKEPDDAPANPGQRPPGGGARYIRRADDPHVYLVGDAFFWLSTALTNWVDTSVVSVPTTEIIGASVDHASTESLTLAWKENALTLTKIAPGKQAKASEINSVKGALNGVRLENIIAADSAEAQALDFATTFTATNKNGTRYTVATAEANSKAYIALSAAYGQMLLTDTDKLSTETEATAKAAAAVAEKAAPEFNKRHAPWVYELSTWSAKNFQKKRSELMEDIPAPPPTPTEPKKEFSPLIAPPAGMPAGHPTIAPAPSAPKPIKAPKPDPKTDAAKTTAPEKKK